jgi:hypothetical protein
MRLPLTLYLAALLCAWLCGAASAQQPPAGKSRSADGLRPARMTPQAGDQAPDFTLPRLDPYLEGRQPADAQTNAVTLSATVGQQPVVLIFGSFT